MGEKQTIQDAIHFIGAEEQNLIKNVANFGEDFFLIHNLDILYQECLGLKPIDKPDLRIPAFLFLNAHREFYLGVVSFLRLHQSKSFCSLRSALDSAFTAYYLLKYPEKIEIYLSSVSGEPSNEWKRIFLNIKKTIEQNIKDFPSATSLPEMHEFCSVFSHSDALGIISRYKIDKEKSMLLADYFDYEDSLKDYKKWFGGFLYGFFRVFLVFWKEMFEQRAESALEGIKQKISTYENKLSIFMKNYPIKEMTIQE